EATRPERLGTADPGRATSGDGIMQRNHRAGNVEPTAPGSWSARNGVDPDNDRAMRRPAGWRKAKEALGGLGPRYVSGGYGMVLLERLPDGHPRILLNVACSHFASLPQEQRTAIIRRFWSDQEARAAMRRIGFTDDELDAAPLDPAPRGAGPEKRTAADGGAADEVIEVDGLRLTLEVTEEPPLPGAGVHVDTVNMRARVWRAVPFGQALRLV